MLLRVVDLFLVVFRIPLKIDHSSYSVRVGAGVLTVFNSLKLRSYLPQNEDFPFLNGHNVSVLLLQKNGLITC